MLFDNCILFIGELRRTVDNFIRHADFADIMQQRHVVDVLTLLGRESQFLRKHPRVFRHSDGMPFRIFIFGIDCVCKRLHDLYRQCFNMVFSFNGFGRCIDVFQDYIKRPDKQVCNDYGQKILTAENLRIHKSHGECLIDKNEHCRRDNKHFPVQVVIPVNQFCQHYNNQEV